MKRQTRLHTLLASCIILFSLTTTAACQTAPLGNQAQIEILHQVNPPDYDFAVVGDSRGGLDVLAGEIAQMAEYHPRFVIHLGDLVGESTSAQYAAAERVLQKIPFPYIQVMGNHDRAREGPTRFLARFGEPTFSFDLGTTRFIILDNSQGVVTDVQLAWLNKQLATPGHKFLLAHEPPATKIWTHAFSHNAPAFMKLLEANHADFALFSHLHLYDHMDHNGVHYIISGGGGAPLYAGMPLAAKDGAYIHHFLIFHVRGDKISYEMIPYKGSESHIAED